MVLALLKKKKEKDVASQVPALLLLPMGTGYSYKGLEEKSFVLGPQCVVRSLPALCPWLLGNGP